MTPGFDLWVYLSSTPLLWLTVTLIVWASAERIAIASGRHPAVNPVLISIIVLGAILILTGNRRSASRAVLCAALIEQPPRTESGVLAVGVAVRADRDP